MTSPPAETAPDSLGAVPARVTIVGTQGNDHLVGTPGPDVIDGGGGDDDIDGRGGNDIILGGPGDDTLLGGRGDDILLGGLGNDTLLAGQGNDTVLGGNGADLVSASFGTDKVAGGNGDDILAGGPDADQLWGELGDDAVAGGYGDDIMSGGFGADRVSGADGVDVASGGHGPDSCDAEKVFNCETAVTAASRTAQLSQPGQASDGTAYTVNWSVAASRGIRLVEIYANDTLVDYSADSGTSASGTAHVPVSELTPGVRTYLYVVVTDTDGEQTGSAVQPVELPEQSHALPPATTVELSQPTDMTTVVGALQAAGLTPLEYVAENIPAPAPQADPEVAQQMQADGFTPYVRTDQELHYQPGQTPLDDQAADIASYYADHQVSGNPLISTVVLRSQLSQAGLGPFGQLGRIAGSVTGKPSQATTTRATTGASQAPTTLAQAAQAMPVRTGRTASPALSSAVHAAAAGQVGFWPKFGRMNVDTYSRSRNRFSLDCGLSFFGPTCRPVIERVSEPKAEIQHQLVWTRESLQLFAANSDAFEQNLVDYSPGRAGTRPACNPFSEDNFYVRAETAKITVDNVPKDAELYNDDVTAEDPCSKNEVSFGIVYPEKLADGVPAGQLPVVIVRQESARNDSADRDFLLAAQSLDRDDYGCGIAPASLKKYCVGVSAGETLQATLARTGGQIGATGLPACVVYSGWAFPPEVQVKSAQMSRTCGSDRDHDGYDDQIDCAPDDPAINPGAVDIPNDGIDQNCDGHDLTVGSGEIQVTLLWDNDNDEDLHVIEPGGTEIWYAAPGPTATGGHLDRDDNVGVCGRDTEPGGVENIFWPTGSTPSRGTYQVNVVQYASCGTPAAWTAEVRIGNVLVKRKSGTGTGSFSFDY